MAKQYICYWLKAVDQYSLQSPFVFKFYNEVVGRKKHFFAFEDIEVLRKKLLNDQRKITTNDLGAGSTVTRKTRRKVANIAQHSLSSPKFAHLLYKLALFCQPENALELGTSLGISTLYLAKAIPGTLITTLEACQETIKIAEESFAFFNAHDIKVIQGNIDDTLPYLLTTMAYVDFVYFDANHTKEATLRYFELCLRKVRDQTVFIFDDIHWSREMFSAWKIICEHPAVSISIDIFDAGIIFFKKDLTKRHYILEY